MCVHVAVRDTDVQARPRPWACARTSTRAHRCARVGARAQGAGVLRACLVLTVRATSSMVESSSRTSCLGFADDHNRD